MGWAERAERDGDGESQSDGHRGRPGALSDPWTNLGSGQTGQQGTPLWERAHREPGSFSSARRVGRGCGACFHGVTGLQGRALGQLGAPSTAPPLPRESLPTTQCTAPQSVLGFHTTPVTSGIFWRVHLTPPFKGAASCGPSPQPALSFRGGGGHHLQPTARPAPGLGRRLGPGTAWGVTQHVAAPLPGVRTFTRLLLLLTSVFFTGLNRCKAGGLQPVQAELSPYGGCLVRWSPAVGSSDDRPPAPGPALWPVPPAVPTWG